MIQALLRAYRESFSGLPGAVWILSGVNFVNRSGTMVLPFLALYLTRERGFTTAEAGRILSLYGIGAMGGAYLGGWLCDVFSPRRIMAWTLGLTGGGFLLLGACETRASIAAMVLALSVVGEAFRPACAAALAECSTLAERARAFALNRLAVNLGMTFGPAAGGILALHSYAWLFLADAVTCLLAAVVLLAAFHGRLGPVPQPARAEGGGGGSPFRDLGFLAMIALTTLLAVVIFQVFGTWTLYLHARYGLSEAAIGSLLAVNTVLIVLFQMPVLHAVRSRPPLAVAGAGGFLFCLGFAVLPFGTTYAYAAFTVVVWTVGEALSLPLVEAASASRAEGGRRGIYMGVLTGAFSAAFILAPLAGTWIYESFGPETLWFGCGLVGALLWGGFRALSRALPARAPEPEGALPDA
jgi:MFS family permease